MPTDYVIVIHGVNTRDEIAFNGQAQTIFDGIRANIQPAGHSRQIKLVKLFWGDVAAESTQALADQLQESRAWSKIWFPDLRLKQVIPFVGDAALYLSRTVSITILNKLIAQALLQIGADAQEMRGKLPLNNDNGDRLHLVTHSWGTVILFDVLFATRWEESDLPAEIRKSVADLRSYFFGVKSLPMDSGSEYAGIPIASLHTMGSPIALFNLLNSAGGKTFNLTPKLREFLESSAQLAGKPLPWQNFLHPGDPISYPLEGPMSASLSTSQDASEFVEITDIVTKATIGAQIFNGLSLGILGGGKAHVSYWNNPDVAKAIATKIQSTFPQ